jgi:hypothetical protein
VNYSGDNCRDREAARLHLSLERIPGALILLAITLTLLLSPAVHSQGRDHLTSGEADLVRNAQELDQRTDLFIQAIQRRLAIIKGGPDPALKGGSIKPPKKRPGDDEEPDWGESPKGTRADLIGDIGGILDEAITNIDNVSRRDQKNPLIAKSLHKLANATKGFLSELNALSPKAKDADEMTAIERAIDNGEQIVEASTKTPAPSEEASPKKKKPNL